MHCSTAAITVVVSLIFIYFCLYGKDCPRPRDCLNMFKPNLERAKEKKRKKVREKERERVKKIQLKPIHSSIAILKG